MNEKHHRPPMIGLSTITRIVGYPIALVWVAPAVCYNLDWQGGSLGDNASAVCFLAAAALCFLGLHWLPDRGLRVLAVLLGLGLTCNNAWNALENISTIDNRRADDRKAKIEDSDRRSSDRRGLSEAVEAADLKVQRKSEKELQREVDSYVSANSIAWTKTGECNPLLTTKSAAFCAEVGRLKGLVEVAKDRDAKLALVRAADTASQGKVRPTNVDDMATTVVVLLAPFGIVPAPESVRAWRALWKTFVLEAQAAIMPAIHVGMIDTLIAAITGAMRLMAAASTRFRNRSAKLENVDTSVEPTPKPAPKPAKSKITPEFERFVASELTVGLGLSILPTPAYKLCCEWRKRQGLPEISQRAFGDMMTAAGPATGWHRDNTTNKGYPIYVGVGQRDKAAKLRVVS